MRMVLVSLEYLSEQLKEENCQNNTNFWWYKAVKIFKMLEIKNSDTQTNFCQSFSASELLDLPWKTVNRRFRDVAQF
jgi:hypothetical protein